MKKSRFLTSSASAIATSLVLFTSMAQANTAPDPQTVVVNGATGTGYVITDSISKSSNNSNVVNSNGGAISLKGATTAESDSKSLTVGNDNQVTVFTNFYTRGGAGSGGGGGLGGVFFVDSGQSLTLNNVQFISNTAKGGKGGAYEKAEVASTIIPLNNLKISVNDVKVVLATPTISYSDGSYYVTGLTLNSSNDLLAAGATIAASGNSSTASIASVNGTALNFSGSGLKVDSSKIASFNTYALGADYLSRGQTTINFSPEAKISASALQQGMAIVGEGIAAGTTISSVTYNTDNTIASVTLNKPVEGTYFNLGNGNTGYNRIGGFQAIQLTDYAATAFETVNSNSIKPVGIPIAGITAGMDVTVKLADGSTTQSRVTGVASDGTITFANNISGMTSFEASRTAASAGSNILNVSSTSGLVKGMSVTGTGIQSGTVIQDIVGSQIILSKSLTSDVTAAIKSNSMYATFGNVLGLDTGAKTVTLGSVAGLKVGQIITGSTSGGSSIPENAVIKSINAATGVVTYQIIDGASKLTVGGSMNGLAATGAAGNGYDGLNGGMWNTTMHDGEGESGLNGGNADNGGTGQNGGTGGKGGSGTRGLPYNLDLIDAVLSDSLDVAQAAASILAEAAPDPFPKVGNVSARSIDMGLKIKSLVRDTLDLVSWQVYLGLGLVGKGGDGSSGGSGGNGGEFLGGGEGGAGGSGGDSATSRADGGAGGDAGSGGNGGFGAGGGSGGSGGSAGWGGTQSAGGDGDGGSGGFGAGAGASAGSGGDGGSGFGGAIFVRDGGSLTIKGDALFRDNKVLAGSGGKGGAAGEAAGTDLFMMKGSNVTLMPGAGNVIRFEGSISDDSAASIGAAYWASGEGADITIIGGGLVQFAGENTYSGNTIIAGATLEAEDGVGIHVDSNIQFDGRGTIGQGTNFSDANAGVWLTTAAELDQDAIPHTLAQGEVVRRVGNAPGEISWVGSGGFAANSNNLLLNFGAIDGVQGQLLTWNSGGFVPTGSTLVFGSEFGTGTVTLANSVDLNGLNGKIAVYRNASAPNAYAVLAGDFTNGTLTVNDTNFAGKAVFTGQNSLTGLNVNTGLLTTILTDGEDATVGRMMNSTLGGYLNVNNTAIVELYDAEKLTTVAVATRAQLYTFGDLSTGTINNQGTIGFGGQSNKTGNITNSGVMSMSNAVETGTINNTGGMALLGTTISTGTITNSGANAKLIADGSTSITTGDINNSAATLSLRSDAITTGNITNSNAGNLWWFGKGDVNGSVLNNATANLYLVGDLSASSTVTNYGTMYVVGTITGADETGAATRKLYTTGLWDPDGVFQLGGLNGTVKNVLEVNQTGISNNSGKFTGAGSLVFQGGGTMNMTGASDFTGGFTINGSSTINTTGGGTQADTLAITVADAGSHLILGSDDLIGSISNAGLVDVNAAIALKSGLANTGTVNVNYATGVALDVAGNVANTGGTINLAAQTATWVGGNLTNTGTVNNSGAALTVVGNLSNNAGGTINVSADSVDTFGSLTNSGTINSASAITVTGAYVQNAGTLTTSAALSTGSLSGTGGTITLNNNAVYTINQTANGTFGGTIAGSGSVVKTGSAALTLKGGGTDSFRPSALTILQGSVGVDGAGILDNALSVSVSSGASLALITGNQTIRNLSGSGSLSLNGNNLYLAEGGNFAGTVTGSGNVQVTSGTFNLTNTINSTSGNFQVRPNSTMNVASTGTLNAPVVDVTGTLDVAGTVRSTTNNVNGVLHLGNSTGTAGGNLISTTTNVNGGGVLSGVGSVTGQVVVGGATGGTLAPGNSPGVMTIANLTLDNNSVSVMEIEGNTAAGLPAAQGGYDQITVTGTLSLRGGSVLKIANSNTFELNLGQKVKVFNFAPGAVSGQFGSVTNAFSRSVAFNLATGSVVGLGSYTPASFETAVAKTTNEQALVNQVRVGTAGGVNQYYGGRLIEFVSSALATGDANNVAAAFDKASPEAYVGLLDHMKLSMLDNRLELGGYENVDRPTYYMTGSVNLGQAKSRERAGYLRYESKDHRYNIGAAAQLPVGKVQVSYGRTEGTVESAYMTGDVNGDQYNVGASVPVAFDGALRLTGRFAYGDYAFKGNRITNDGKASFANVEGNSTVYGGGFEYLHTSNRLSVDFSAELLSVLNKVKTFTETGVGALESLSIHAQRDSFEVLGADLKLGYEFQPGIQGFMAVSLDQDLEDRLHAVSANVSVEAVDMTVMNPGYTPTRVDASIGGRFDLTDAIRFTVEGNVGNASRYGGKASVSIRF